MTSATIRACIATMLLSTAYSTSLDAQRGPDTQGPHLGAAFNATSIKLDETAFSDDERENGYGVDLYAGYNFTRNLGLTLGLTAATIKDSQTTDFGVAHVDLAGRLSFPGASAFVPYLELSFAGVAADYTSEVDEVELKGSGVGLGGGFNYFFSRRAALDVAFRYTMGEFDTAKIANREVETGDGVGFNTTRLKIGIAFYP